MQGQITISPRRSYHATAVSILLLNVAITPIPSNIILQHIFSCQYFKLIAGQCGHNSYFSQSNCAFYQSKGLMDWSLDEPKSLS